MGVGSIILINIRLNRLKKCIKSPKDIFAKNRVIARSDFLNLNV